MLRDLQRDLFDQRRIICVGLRAITRFDTGQRCRKSFGAGFGGIRRSAL